MHFARLNIAAGNSHIACGSNARGSAARGILRHERNVPRLSRERHIAGALDCRGTRDGHISPFSGTRQCHVTGARSDVAAGGDRLRRRDLHARPGKRPGTDAALAHEVDRTRRIEAVNRECAVFAARCRIEVRHLRVIVKHHRRTGAEAQTVGFAAAELACDMQIEFFAADVAELVHTHDLIGLFRRLLRLVGVEIHRREVHLVAARERIEGQVARRGAVGLHAARKNLLRCRERCPIARINAHRERFAADAARAAAKRHTRAFDKSCTGRPEPVDGGKPHEAAGLHPVNAERVSRGNRDAAVRADIECPRTHNTDRTLEEHIHTAVPVSLEVTRISLRERLEHGKAFSRRTVEVARDGFTGATHRALRAERDTIRRDVHRLRRTARAARRRIGDGVTHRIDKVVGTPAVGAAARERVERRAGRGGTLLNGLIGSCRIAVEGGESRERRLLGSTAVHPGLEHAVAGEFASHRLAGHADILIAHCPGRIRPVLIDQPALDPALEAFVCRDRIHLGAGVVVDHALRHTDRHCATRRRDLTQSEIPRRCRYRHIPGGCNIEPLRAGAVRLLGEARDFHTARGTRQIHRHTCGRTDIKRAGRSERHIESGLERRGLERACAKAAAVKVNRSGTRLRRERQIARAAGEAHFTAGLTDIPGSRQRDRLRTVNAAAKATRDASGAGGKINAHVGARERSAQMNTGGTDCSSAPIERTEGLQRNRIVRLEVVRPDISGCPILKGNALVVLVNVHETALPPVLKPSWRVGELFQYSLIVNRQITPQVVRFKVLDDQCGAYAECAVLVGLS